MPAGEHDQQKHDSRTPEQDADDAVEQRLRELLERFWQRPRRNPDDTPPAADPSP